MVPGSWVHILPLDPLGFVILDGLNSSVQGLSFLMKLGPVWQSCCEDEVRWPWRSEPSLSPFSFRTCLEAQGGGQARVGRSPPDSLGGSSRTGYLHVTLLLP